jgi:hypothetical protein
VVADHVTLMSGAGDMPLPTCRRGEVIGRADDGDGVKALVVSIDGSSARPDGGTYHITWSLDQAQGRGAVELAASSPRLLRMVTCCTAACYGAVATN